MAATATKQREWETTMCAARKNNPRMCCLACLLPCCCSVRLRLAVLHGDLSRYRCCQHKLAATCMAKTEPCVTACPPCSSALCLAVEATACLMCSVISTRAQLQEERNIATDPCDSRISCGNLLCQVGSKAAASVLAAANPIGTIVLALVQACIQAQTDLELRLHPGPDSYSDGLVLQQPGVWELGGERNCAELACAVLMAFCFGIPRSILFLFGLL
eukprot:m.191902 g.191902  ORF g.191902 m.191902 type:complete len:217 (+) comp21729_c1_seq4:172-822(+)